MDNQGLIFSSLEDEEGDQNLGLIDISQEDDDLLSDSPSLADFRLSIGFDDVDESRQGCYSLRPSFQNYGRPSLAWDSAFFTNEGVLDEDELTLLNKGFQMAKLQLEDIHTVRFKLGLSTRDDAVSSGSEKANISTQNWKNKPAFGRAAMNNTQRSLKDNKTQMKGSSKREESHFLPLRAPKVSSSPKINLLPGKNRKASNDGKKENRSHSACSVDNLKMRKNSGMENKCRLTYASPSPSPAGVAESPYMMKNLQMNSPFNFPQKEEANSPAQLSFYSTPDTSHASTESRKEPKPSNLRPPSPTIGFFDEKKSNEHRRSKVWSSVSSSVADLKSQSGELGEWICAKCRKTGTGILDRKRVGRISVSRQDDAEKMAKGRMKSRWRRDTVRPNDDTRTPRELTKPIKNAEPKAKNLQSGTEDDQLNDLSKYFELMDLTKDKANDERHEAPRTLSNHSPRTPLSDKTSNLSNISGSMKQPSSREKVPEKPFIHTFTDKENSVPYAP